MAIRFALFGTPLIAGAVLVLVMNAVDASPGVAMAGLGIVAVASGTAFGYFADYLPELPRVRRMHPVVPRHVDR
jgi:hypothetical protein